MNKKTKIKIISAFIGSLFFLLVLILGSINIYNFSRAASDADHITQMIADNGGSFNMNNNREEKGPMGPDSPEVSFSTRYFTFAFKSNGDAIKVAFNIQMVSEKEAIEWARGLIGKNRGWTRTSYRFRSYVKESTDYVTVIDQSRELSPSYRVLNASIVGSFVGLGVLFVVVCFSVDKLSKYLNDREYKERKIIRDTSKELNQPLSSISNNIDSLQKDNVDSKEIEEIKLELDHINSILYKLNESNKINKTTIQKEEFNLSNLAKDVCNNFVGIFKKESKEFTSQIDNEIFYNGEKEKIENLFIILLDNSIKYCKTRTIFSLLKENERVVICVENDSEGVAEGPLDTVFERYYRSEDVVKSGIDGAGVGLYIAKDIVKAHKGRISARGENGLFIIKVEL